MSTTDTATDCIMIAVENELSAWLTAEVEERGWSFRELARRAGLSSSAVINVINGKRNPGDKFCHAIARVFRLKPEIVFRRAGLLPPEPKESASLKEVIHLFHQLHDDTERERALVIFRAMVEAQEQARQELASTDHSRRTA